MRLEGRRKKGGNLLLAAPAALTVAFPKSEASTALDVVLPSKAAAASLSYSGGAPSGVSTKHRLPGASSKAEAALNLWVTSHLSRCSAAQGQHSIQATDSWSFCSFSPAHTCALIPALIPLCWKGLVTERYIMSTSVGYHEVETR